MVAGQLRRYVVLNVLTAADRAALLLTDSWKKMARLINPTKLRVDKVEIQHTNSEMLTTEDERTGIWSINWQCISAECMTMRNLTNTAFVERLTGEHLPNLLPDELEHPIR